MNAERGFRRIPWSISLGLVAWVLWTNDLLADGQWKLHSAYTFRATCLVMGAYWGGSRYLAIGADGKITRVREKDPGAINLPVRTWCLPPGVRPE